MMKCKRLHIIIMTFKKLKAVFVEGGKGGTICIYVLAVVQSLVDFPQLKYKKSCMRGGE